jgi:hypothetical protein
VKKKVSSIKNVLENYRYKTHSEELFSSHFVKHSPELLKRFSIKAVHFSEICILYNVKISFICHKIKFHCCFTHTHTHIHKINSLHSQCQVSSNLKTNMRSENLREREEHGLPNINLLFLYEH